MASKGSHARSRRSSRPSSSKRPSTSKTPARRRTPGAMRSAGPAVGLRGSTPVQRKIAVGPADDAYERQADAVADRVSSNQPAPTISRVPPSGIPQSAQRETAKKDDSGEEKKAQTKPVQREEVEAAEEEDTKAAQTLQREEAAKDDEPAEGEAQQMQALQREEAPQKEDEKTGATGEIPSEEEAVQSMAQRAEASAEEATEGEEAQTKRRGPESRDSESLSDAADRAVREKGQGEPLDPSLRRSLESSLRSDLGDVRVHRGQRAEDAARALNARAFTHDRDIWLGRGESPHNTKLMAHEAAHVVQQTSRAQRPVVQREGEATAGPGAGAGASPDILTSPAGTIDVRAKTMSIPSLQLPTVANKQSLVGDVKASKPGRVDNTQRTQWLENISGAGVATKVEELLPDSKAIPSPTGVPLFYVKLQNQNSFLVGDRETIKQQARLPNWNSGGRNDNLQVDHVHELQIGGPITINNLQLLDAETNRSSGNAIRNEVKEKIEAAVRPHVGAGKHWPEMPSADSIRADFNEIKFESVTGGLPVAGNDRHWTLDQVQNQGAHLNALHVMTMAEVQASNVPLVGNATRFMLYMSPSAGQPKSIPWGPEGATGGLSQIAVRGFHPTGLTYTPGQGGELTGKAFKRNKVVEESDLTIPVADVGGLQNTGRLMTDSVKNQLRLSAKGLSPIELEDAQFTDEYLGVRGVINVSVPMFKSGTTLDIAIDGDDVMVSKTFTAGDFELPGPVQITEAALTISVGTRGLNAEGNVKFEIQGVGQGQVTAAGDISGGFSAEGEFEFDKELFNDADAKIRVRYADEKFSGEGTLKIGEGKVRGVKSAELTVGVDGEVWTATGTVEPDVPGVRQGTLGVTFDPNGGLEITGRLEFSSDIPRLKSGHLEATVTKTDEGYSVEGSGAAELDIPGAAASITAEYKDGLFKAEGALAYEKGIASGTITAGVTNMPVGEDGTPAGEPGDTLAVYGSGSITIKFTPWLEGTAGIKISPSGRMEITGRVALPDSVEVFPQKSIEKELLSVGVDIPIVGVAVAGQRVGIFLNISGNLTARASIGPGELKDVAVEVSFDPEDEASARITGSARFVVPAEAGLRLGIRGAIGAGIPIVSAQAGIEIGGELGVEGEASASATIEWTPATGINMEAALELMAQPKFTFDITGFVEVTADLFLTEVELYSKRWQLAAVEFGSDMQVGARLPVRVVSGELQDISTDDIEFITPDIDPIDIATGLIDQIK